jgi:uncharacterized membrane protein YdjX (TVP38/TMEM64 family)
LKDPKKDKTVKTILAILKFAVLVGIIVAIPLLLYFQFPEVILQFRSLETVNAMLDEYKSYSMLIYIALQIFQIVVSVIPGQIIQLAAGYAFGLGMAYILTIVGIGIGTIATFYLAKILGRDILYLIFGEKKLEKFIKLLNSKKAFVAILILFLFPGIPKDLFVYAAGVSKIRPIPFLLLNLAARSPALICSLLFGTMFRTENYAGMIAIGAVVAVIAIFAIIFRKRVYDWIDKIYAKFIG